MVNQHRVEAIASFMNEVVSTEKKTIAEVISRVDMLFDEIFKPTLHGRMGIFGHCDIYTAFVCSYLDALGIKFILVDMARLGAMGPHVFLLTNENGKHILIDSSFIWFTERAQKRMFPVFYTPESVLCRDEKGTEFYSNLINNRYSEIDQNLFNRYVTIFNGGRELCNLPCLIKRDEHLGNNLDVYR